MPLPLLIKAAAVRESVEALIVKKARRFDLCALLDLLYTLDYKDSDIKYRSHDSTLHQSAVIDTVAFVKSPRRQVIITVNLGWLAPQSALPNYFRKVLAEQREESMSEFLGFFAHHLLRKSCLSAFPSRDGQIFKDWGKSRQQLRSLLGLRSLSTIHWVFGLVFPEMEVAVKRTILKRTVHTRGMVLGSWVIGDGVACGGVAQVPVSAVAVTLLCDEAVSFTGRPWAIEAVRRLQDEVFPTLAVHGLFLYVLLVIRDQRSFMILKPEQYLGYEPISGTSAAPVPPRKAVRSVVLWNAEVPCKRKSQLTWENESRESDK